MLATKSRLPVEDTWLYGVMIQYKETSYKDGSKMLPTPSEGRGKHHLGTRCYQNETNLESYRVLVSNIPELAVNVTK